MSKSRTRSAAARAAIVRRARSGYGLKRPEGITTDCRLRDIDEVDPDCEPTTEIPVDDSDHYEPRVGPRGVTR